MLITRHDPLCYETNAVIVSQQILNGFGEYSTMNASDIYRAVQERYSAASWDRSDDGYALAVATSFGYSRADLESIPKDANLGLSCGNPQVIAGLREACFARTYRRIC